MKFNYFLSSSVSSWLLVLLVIASELSSPFKQVLTSTFGHHWIAKVVLVAIAFVALGFLLKDKHSLIGFEEEDLAWKSALGSLGVIFVFYIIHFFI